MKIKISYSDLCTLHDCLVVGAAWRKDKIRAGENVELNKSEFDRTLAITNKIEDLLQHADLFSNDFEILELEAFNGKDENNKKYHGV